MNLKGQVLLENLSSNIQVGVKWMANYNFKLSTFVCILDTLCIRDHESPNVEDGS